MLLFSKLLSTQSITKFVVVSSLFFLNEAKANVGDKILISSAQSSQAILGKGYDVNQERFVGDCVQGTSSYAGAPESSLTFERSLSATETADSLGFAVGGKARYGLITASAAARFASETTSNDYSEVTVYSSEYRFKNVKLNYTGLTEIGKLARQGSRDYVWENWEKTCGHTYVEQIQLGAKLMISAKVEFASKEDKKSFAAEFKIKGPAFSAAGELKKASRQFGKSASVSIRAFQLGGDVSRLSAIFGEGAEAKIDVDGKKIHALLVCSMDQIQACTQVLNHALTYATATSDAQAFPNQIKPNYDTSQPNGPAELAYIVKPWADLAFYQPPLIVGELVKSARNELSRKFETLLKLHKRVLALSSGPFRLSQNQSLHIDWAAGVISENMSKIMKVASTCYLQPENCPHAVTQLESQLEAVPIEYLDIKPEVFAQWCDALDSGLMRRSAKTTVNALLEIAARELDLNQVSDKCAAAEIFLEEEKEIELSGQSLNNLLPLASLLQVEVLHLQNNQITDIAPLSKLSQLRELNLSDNLVRSLEGISHLKNLQRLKAPVNNLADLPANLEWPTLKLLWLGYNHLSEVSALNNLAQVSNLRLDHNKINFIEPLAQMESLESLNLSYNKIQDFHSLSNLPHLSTLHVEGNTGKCPQSLLGICENVEM